MKRLRQAEETGGEVAVLCFACRHSSNRTKQQGIAGFFSSNRPTPSEQSDATRQCSRCLRVMAQPVVDRSGLAPPAAASRVLPQIVRIRSYQRVAEQQGVPFLLSERAGIALMREACVLCGARPPTEGHGLTRLRVWPEGTTPLSAEEKRPRGLTRGAGFMGPFHLQNLAPACSTCNLMKGARRVRAFVEACRHIATHRSGEGFGSYPHRFRNNTSRRCRSSYITASSTHNKTHALSNEAFNAIVARPCHYCGKESKPPHHHNGLDRLDSSCRVYTAETCVSCCGDCNVMKYTHTEQFFLKHVRAVALHNVGVEHWPGDVDSDDGEDDGDGVVIESDELNRFTDDLDSNVVAGSSSAPTTSINPFSEFAFAP
ncbi:hypothetical protein AB1Y20_009776 [Prymnesium parvum]|uniref:HNH nuclease domain-containing protein n=1 Tax=Prymnesium parvum TaxID=97485 RepID=A0AB34K573_PRYPA